MFPRLALIFAAAALILSMSLSGCSTVSEHEQPRTRLGSLPFQGPFTFYAVADPDDLGLHRYEPWWDRLDGPSETSRGIMYACRAGFIDLAHFRESIDLTRYIHDRTRELLLVKTPFFSLEWTETNFRFTPRFPDWWTSLSEPDKAALIEETAIRMGARSALIIATWHEIGTWYGQMTVPPVSEATSAFTWDDTTSHVLGAMVAERALRSGAPLTSDLEWDQAVTAALPLVLAEVGIQNRQCEDAAMRKAEGRWWKGFDAVRRDLQTGLDTGTKIPWLIPDLDCCPGAQPMPLPVPSLADVRGHDMRPVLQLRILPPAWMMRRITFSDEAPESIDSEAAMLAVIEKMRAELKDLYGENADKP